MLLALVPNAGVIQYMCEGSATSNGIIAAAPIVGIGTAGVTSVVGLTVVIMLTIVLVMAGLYMIGQVIGQPSLQNFIKVELAEMVGTAVIIVLFFGGFFAAAYAAAGPPPSANVTNPTLYFYGPGRSVFVNDCVMVGGTSLALLPPVLTSGGVTWVLNLLDSMTLKITPGGFGFRSNPLQGMDMLVRTMTQLSQILSTFMVVLLALTFLLGLIYSLFPLFLYLGIVLRAFPWTRAAGGIFIAMFIGFYIVFPLMISATVGGFSSAAYNQSYQAYSGSSAANGIMSMESLDSTSNSIGVIGQQSSLGASISNSVTYFTGFLGSLVGYPNGYGIVNGYIQNFMGPPIMVIIEVAFSFIVALDFADSLSDLLGAPSLSTQRLLGKMV